MSSKVRFGVCVVAFCLLALPVLGDVPQTINHQGVIKVNGQPFNGTGHFKFAIINSSGLNVWTNDSSNLILNGVPNTFEDVTVADGVYNVMLGGTGPGYTMTPIAATVFSEPDRKLRIWFDDGTNGVQQLTPDQELTSSPYSQQAAFQPPIGSIIAWHKSLPAVPALPDGWVECTNPTGALRITDPASPLNGQIIPDLNSTPVGFTGGGRFLRGSTTSGTPQEATTIAEMNSWGDVVWGTTRHSDGDTSDLAWSFEPVVSAGPEPRSALWHAVRPVNMSVVWIMRVK